MASSSIPVKTACALSPVGLDLIASLGVYVFRMLVAPLVSYPLFSIILAALSPMGLSACALGWKLVVDSDSP